LTTSRRIQRLSAFACMLRFGLRSSAAAALGALLAVGSVLLSAPIGFVTARLINGARLIILGSAQAEASRPSPAASSGIMRSFNACMGAAGAAALTSIGLRHRSRMALGRSKGPKRLTIMPSRAPAAVSRCATTSAAATVAKTSSEEIDRLVEENKVMVFSKSTCPFCSRAKDMLQAEGIDFEVLELDTLPPAQMEDMQQTFAQLTGARTVPRIFIQGQCIGGCDDVMALQQSGKLADAVESKAVAADFRLQLPESEWKKKLGNQKYRILRMQGTEAPGSHEYDQFYPQQGHFTCGACGLPLYSAESKFRSNCGWPVFDKCYFSEEAGGCHVGTRPDFPGSLEIICNRCESHLGHVFFDAFSAKNPNGERH